MMRSKVDFRVVNHGTVYLLYPNTLRAKQWVKDNLPRDHMQYGGASVVEHQYIADIIDDIQAEQLEIVVSTALLLS
jgi:hypothetical protein